MGIDGIGRGAVDRPEPGDRPGGEMRRVSLDAMDENDEPEEVTLRRFVSGMVESVGVPERFADKPRLVDEVEFRHLDIDRRKLAEYSMCPDNKSNQGKDQGWRMLGYDVDSPQGRQYGADAVVLLLPYLVEASRLVETRNHEHGPGYLASVPFQGLNGRPANLVTAWLRERPDTLRMTTIWVEPHKEGQ